MFSWMNNNNIYYYYSKNVLFAAEMHLACSIYSTFLPTNLISYIRHTPIKMKNKCSLDE